MAPLANSPSQIRKIKRTITRPIKTRPARHVGSCCQEIAQGLERHRAVGREMDPIEAKPHHRPADENDERNYPRAGPKDLQGQRPAASGGGLPPGIGAAQVTTSPEA